MRRGAAWARRRFGLTGVVLLVGLASKQGWGTTYSWNVGNGTFGTAGSWTPAGGPPGSLDNAQFALAGSHTVTFTASVTNTNLNMTAGTVFFTGSATNPTYTVSGVADIHGATLTLNGTAQEFKLSSNTLQVYNGSTVTVSEGNDIATGILNIGASSPAVTSTLLFTGSDSTLTATSLTNIGATGAMGVLTFQDGAHGTLASVTTVNSSFATSAARINVESASDVTASGNLIFGQGSLVGQSTAVTVKDVGSTFVQSGVTTVTLGASANSTAALNVNSNGTFTTGTGALTINKTGTLTIGGGTLNANGNITVNGVLQWNSGTFNWAAGKTMTVQNGGIVTLTTTFYSMPMNAVVNVDGVGSQLTLGGSALSFTNGTQLNVTNGGAVSAGVVSSIGVGGTTGTAIIDGAGSSFTVTGNGIKTTIGSNAGTGTFTARNNASVDFHGGLQVGGSGTSGNGTLNVQSGATVSCGALDVGLVTNVGSTGVINLSGGTISVIFGGIVVGATAGSATGAIHITGGTFNSGTSQTLINDTGTLSINGGTFNALGRTVVKGDGLQIGGSAGAWTGTFNLGDKKMVVQASPATKVGLLATLQDQVNYGKTHAFGITSSTLPPNTAIAVMDNFVLGFDTFAFISVGDDSILVAPELLGDANADGTVNFSDFVVLSNNFGQPNKGWVGADFNGDGTTGFTDFVTLSNHFGQTFGSPSLVVGPDEYAAFAAASAAFVAAVPEPGAVLVLGIGCPALMGSRGRLRVLRGQK